MATHFPPINQPLEGVPHPKRVEDLLRKHGDDITRILAMITKMRRDGATNSKQVVDINNRVRRISPGMGVPPGGLWRDRLGKLSDDTGDFDWVRNTLGGAELAFYQLPEDGDSVNLLDEYEAKFHEVNIDSTADNEPYTIRLPETLHIALDVGTPMYMLSLNVFGHSVDLTLQGDVPTYYDHPGVYIMDTPYSAGEGTITLPAGYSGQWFVMGNISTGEARAIPLQDVFYDGRFGPSLSAGPTPPTVVATAAAGTSPTVTVNGTSTSGVVELLTGTSPTTTGWGELLTFTNGWASGDVPVLTLYPANQAAAALNHYGNRSGTEAEAHFDLTGITASTTYKFHYSLLPYTAV